MSTATAEHALIAHQGIGDQFTGVYYVEQFFIKLTVNGKEYTDMVLRDKSGSRSVKAWTKLTGIEKGEFVFVSARVEDYQGAPSIIAKNVNPEEAPENLSNYIAVYDDAGDNVELFDTLQAELTTLCANISDDTPILLVEEVFKSGKLFATFIAAPGSAKPHYGRQGGLLARTVRVAKMAHNLAGDYDLTDVEQAVMLAGGLLHRLGSVDAFAFQDCAPVSTLKGELLGSGNLSMMRLAPSIRRTVEAAQKDGKTIKQDTLIRILHVIASHDSACVKPKTREALLLSSCVKNDDDLVEAMDFIANDLNEQEEFTAFDPATKRRYYRGA